jgi:arabinofuranan 3-O-arabinosyltransferase
VPLETCGTPITHLVGHVQVAAGPTRSFRVDSVTLRRLGSHLQAATPVTVHRDGGLPTSVNLPARSGPEVLSLPQNLNPGYQASLGGSVLPVQAVDSWQQGWVVPAGPAATVQLRFAPQRLFDVLLVVGALLVLVVVAAAIPWRRRTEPELPPLTAAGPGLVDAFLATAVLGFLAGWVGVGALALTWVLYRRFVRLRDWWVYVAGVELLVATAALTWGPLKASSWALDWAQVWAALAVATVSVVLLAPGTPGRFSWRRAPAASSSARS